MRRTHFRLSALALLLLGVPSGAEAPRRILHLAELNTAQIQALDRTKTVVLIPGGILEEHGPYLPSFSDGYQNEWITDRLAQAVAARPGWTALIVPTIPLGVGGANEIGGRSPFPGTYAVRSKTLRDVFVDLASELGDQGFRFLFVVHWHGAPMHSRALDDAGEFFRDTYRGHMVHLFGLMPVFTAGGEPPPGATPDFDVHAGAGETSNLLFVRPDLVAAGYRTAPPQRGKDWDDLVRTAHATSWPGYFSAPSEASAERGRTAMETAAKAATENMLRIVDGADERTIPHYAALMEESAANVAIDRVAAERERARAERLAKWLAQRSAAHSAPTPGAAP